MQHPDTRKTYLRIKSSDTPCGYAVICKEDYDPKQHELIHEEAKPAAAVDVAPAAAKAAERPKVTAAEAIRVVKDSTDVDGLQAMREGETRTTVLNAIDARIAELIYDEAE